MPKKSKAQGQTIKKILFRKKIYLVFFASLNCSTIPNSKITDDNFIEACLVLGALGKFWHILTIVQIIVNIVFTPSLYRSHLYEGYKYPFEILSFLTIYQKTRRCNLRSLYSFFRIRLYREMFQSVTAMRKKNDMQFDW